jgi:WD40 repeat protein
VVVYETKSFTQLMTFQGHMMSVQRLSWAPGDQVLFSSGMDGNVYGWIVSNAPGTGSGAGSMSGGGDNRLDIVTANNRSSSLLALTVDCPSPSFFRPAGGDDIKTGASFESDRRSVVILSSANGGIRSPPFSLGKPLSSPLSVGPSYLVPPFQGEVRHAITCMCLTQDRRHLIAGTISGRVRVYAWPPVVAEGASDGPAYMETIAHNGPVVAVALAPHQNTFVSAGDDGSVFVHSLVRGGDFERTLIDHAPNNMTHAPIGKLI